VLLISRVLLRRRARRMFAKYRRVTRVEALRMSRVERSKARFAGASFAL